jgi:hypothetical protein
MNKLTEENNNENDSIGNTSNSDNVNENGKRGKRTRIFLLYISILHVSV